MTINIQQTQNASLLSGFKERPTGYVSFAATVPSVVIPAGGSADFTITTNFNDSTVVYNNISACQIKYDGIDTFWRHLDGFVFADYPSAAAPTYEIGSITYFNSTQHFLYTYIANQTGAPINSPAFTLRFIMNLFDGPFS